jgi:LL-diaminopimelate aminotransferase
MTVALTVAPRIRKLADYPFAILEKRVQKLQAAGRDIIRLDMGSPDMPPPPAVIEALAKSAANPHNHGYAGYRGTAEFRRAIAAYYQRRFGVELDPDTQVMPLMGSKEGIVNLTLALAGPGDVVLVPSIGYPAYAMGTQLAEAEVVEMPLRAENGFVPALQDIKSMDRERARMLWINYPNNPTSAFCSREFYAEAVAFCREHNILLCSDNAYLEVTFDGLTHAPSALEVPGATDTTVEMISFSKSHNMAGWRLGAAVGNAQALSALLRVKSNVDSGHFRAIYDAGIVALETTPQTWLDERNARYAARRDKLVEIAPQIRLAIDSMPRGSLYVWARVLGMSDIDYAEHCLMETEVSVTPGSIYGSDGGGYVRISLGVDDETLDRAIERLTRYWRSQV